MLAFKATRDKDWRAGVRELSRMTEELGGYDRERKKKPESGRVMAFVVVLDANVLYPFTLRDTLLRAAAANLYELQWSAMILDEMERNLVDNGATTLEQAARLRATMERVFPDAMVTGFERLIAAMKNDEKDLHVAAAAVKCGAQLIVTSNVKDFADFCRTASTFSFPTSSCATSSTSIHARSSSCCGSRPRTSRSHL